MCVCDIDFTRRIKFQLLELMAKHMHGGRYVKAKAQKINEHGEGVVEGKGRGGGYGIEFQTESIGAETTTYRLQASMKLNKAPFLRKDSRYNRGA